MIRLSQEQMAEIQPLWTAAQLPPTPDSCIGELRRVPHGTGEFQIIFTAVPARVIERLRAAYKKAIKK